jgi:hypothetical protein
VCRAPSLSLPLSVHASRWPTRSTAMPTNPKTDDAGLPTSLRDTEAMLFVCAGMMPGFLRAQHYKTTIPAATTAEPWKRPSANPPWFTGLSSRSPIVAPRGRVRMNAAQNSTVRETLV